MALIRVPAYESQAGGGGHRHLLSLGPHPNYTLPSRKAKVDVTFGPLASAAPALEPEVLVSLGLGGSYEASGIKLRPGTHSCPILFPLA